MAQEDEEEARQLAGMFAEVFEFVLENYVDETRLDPELLIEGALDGMFEALDDPYSSYIRPDEVPEITDLTRERIRRRVGMYVAPHREGGAEVISPIEGPAGASGGSTRRGPDRGHRRGVRSGVRSQRHHLPPAGSARHVRVDHVPAPRQRHVRGGHRTRHDRSHHGKGTR